MKAISRVVSTTFWTDETVVTDFSPEDKYFYLYLLTNPHTTQLGVYKFVPKTAAFELGYSVEAVMVLLERFQGKYGMIKYSSNTSEIAIKNYLKHSIMKGGKPVYDCLLREESLVKDRSLLEYIYINLRDIDYLNITVKEYIEHLGNICKEDINENDNDNDNERIVPRIVNESLISQIQQITEQWNRLSDIGITPISRMTSSSQRYKWTVARLREYGLDEICRAIENVRHSSWLRSGKFNFSYDWFIRPNNFIKVLDGNYLDKDYKEQPKSKPIEKDPIEEQTWSEEDWLASFDEE